MSKDRSIDELMEALDGLTKELEVSQEELQAKSEAGLKWLRENLHEVTEKFLVLWQGFGHEDFPLSGAPAHAIQTLMPAITGVAALLPDEGDADVMRLSIALSLIASLHEEQGGWDGKNEEADEEEEAVLH